MINLLNKIILNITLLKNNIFIKKYFKTVFLKTNI